MAVEQYEQQQTTRMNKQCLKEIERHLHNIETKLKGYQDKQNSKLFHDILENLQVIEDLAMVYGYDGMETLAFHLTNAIQSRIKVQNKIPNTELPRLSLIVKAMRNMYGEEDDKKIFAIVKRAIDEIQEAKPDEAVASEPVAKRPEPKIEQTVQSANPAKGAKRPLFDIREARSIRKLIHKIETNNRELPDNPNVRSEQVKTIDQSNDNGRDINQEIEQVFNEVFVEETLESLFYLEEYLQMAREGKSLGESIMHIKDAWSSLADSANCFQVGELQTPLSMLNKLAREKLDFTEQPPVDLLDLMDDAEKMIRSYVKDENRDHDFASLIDRIRDLDFLVENDQDVDAKIVVLNKSLNKNDNNGTI
ncbi:hypothetical protein JW960_14700 [candidate division KSB1 bacterium]|nr:hypothetical protein [candidate division KSB1 bacterium]